MNKSNFFLAVFTTIISVYKKSTPKIDIVEGVYYGHWYFGSTKDLAICTIERINENTVKLNFNPLTQYGYKIDGIIVSENQQQEMFTCTLTKEGFMGNIEKDELNEDKLTWSFGSTSFTGTKAEK